MLPIAAKREDAGADYRAQPDSRRDPNAYAAPAHVIPLLLMAESLNSLLVLIGRRYSRARIKIGKKVPP